MRWILLLFVGCLLRPALATTHVVRPDGSGDWPTIQIAIFMAQPGDIIELTDGTFRGDGHRDLDFLGRILTIRSQSGDPYTCIIDCEGTESEPHRGFDFDSGEGSDTIVQGITVTGGLQAGC